MINMNVTNRQPEEDSQIVEMEVLDSQKVKTSDDDETIFGPINRFIGNIQHAPQYIQDQYIQSGYRINFSKRDIFKSLFMSHNETVNVWTHLIGIFVLLILAVYVFGGSTLQQQTNSKQYFEKDINSYFQPILELISKTDVEQSKLNKYTEMVQTQLKGLINNVEQSYNHFKDNKYKKLVHKIDQMKDQSIKKMMELYQYYQDNHLISKMEIHQQFKQTIKQQLEQLKGILMEPQYDLDWLDIYQHFPNSQLENKNKITKIPIAVFLTTGVLCLLCSSIFHLFNALNPQTFKWLSRLDYAGINLLITGSTAPPYIYGFYCQKQHYGVLYFTIIGIGSLFVFFISLFQFIHTRPYARVKAYMYGFLGISASFPFIHLALVDSTFVYEVIPWYGLLGFFYLSGLAIYTSRYPECKYPVSFDICGQSHQIWHICVLLGLFSTYLASLKVLHYRYHNQCPI